MKRLVLRRLLAMPITLLGVTLLVFVLVALSPGGLGGEDDADMDRRERAYLDDRYGVHDHVLVQYGRWLARISPIKFGEPLQIDRDGSPVGLPRALPEVPLQSWVGWSDDAADVAGSATAAKRGSPAVAASTPQSDQLRAAREHLAKARADYLDACEAVRAAAQTYADAAGIGNPGPRPERSRLISQPPRRELPEFQELATSVGTAARLRRVALEAAAPVERLLSARPLRIEGTELVPGVLSVAWPDLGVSRSKRRPVLDLVQEHLPVTLLLNAFAVPLTYLIAIPGGVLAAARRGSWLDSLISVSFSALWSVPVAWAVVVCIGFLAAAPPVGLGWFPIGGLSGRGADAMAFLPATNPQTGAWEHGYVLDVLWHTVLPVLCLSYGGLAVLARQARSATLANLGADFARTARAKGCSERDVLLKHVLPNGLLPLITVFVGVFPAMLSGSVIVERAFGIPGMGRLLIEAGLSRDREVLLAAVLLFAVVNILALLVADLLYALADPRIRVAGAASGAEGGHA